MALKSAKKKTARPARKSSKITAASTETPLVTAQPQSKQQAATSAGMFLYTNDSWSNNYWNPNDLHFKERTLFA